MCVPFDTHTAGAYAVLFGGACSLSLLQALPVLARFSSAPLGPEDQGGFRFPPLDPLDSCIPLETTRGCGPWTRGGIQVISIYVALAVSCLEQPSLCCSRCKPLRTIALPPTGVQGFTPGRFKGDMGSLREVRGEIEIPPPPLGPSGAGPSSRTFLRYEHTKDASFFRKRLLYSYAYLAA